MGHTLGKILHILQTLGSSLLVFVVLGLLAYWGNANDWKVPKFSSLWSGGEAAKEEEKPQVKVWSADTSGADQEPWCEKHGLPEVQCTICHPDISVKGVSQTTPRQSPATVAERSGVETIPNPRACRTHHSRIEFTAEEEGIRNAGIQLGNVEERLMTQYITANGKLDYDQYSLAHLSTRVPGVVWQMPPKNKKIHSESLATEGALVSAGPRGDVLAKVGQYVHQGDILALIESTEVGRLKAVLLQALAQFILKSTTYEKIKAVAAEGGVSQQQVLEAKAARRAARIQLLNAQQSLANLGLPVPIEELENLPEDQLITRIRFLGLPKSVTERLDPKTATTNLVPIKAPFDGLLIGRDVVVGEIVTPNQTQFTLVDNRRMRVLLDVQLEDTSQLTLGQEVTFQTTGETAIGKITYISTSVDPKTRTVRVHAEVDNSSGRLRAESFGTGKILVRETPRAIVVPQEAVQWDGCCHIVFVKINKSTFQPRKVRLGLKNGRYTEILAGVLPGEVIATTGSHVLKSELLKSRIGGDDE